MAGLGGGEGGAVGKLRFDGGLAPLLYLMGADSVAFGASFFPCRV